MEFFETPIFTKLIHMLISAEQYHQLQLFLAERPDAGDIIKGSGGIRKIRWAGSGRGKRGGIRVIYYFISEQDKIFMLYAYPKNEQDDLNSSQIRQLRQMVEEHLL